MDGGHGTGCMATVIRALVRYAVDRAESVSPGHALGVKTTTSPLGQGLANGDLMEGISRLSISPAFAPF